MSRQGRFPTTMWSTILGRPKDARTSVFLRYREPVLAFLRRQGFGEHDADDLAQEVFATVCREEFLRAADRGKGRFRSLLLGVARNVVLHARRSRGRSRLQPLDDAPEPAASERDPEFDTMWIQHLVELGLERLQAGERPGGPRHYDAFVLHKVKGLAYKDVAERLGVEVSDVRNWIHAARTRLQEHIREEVLSYCSSREEFEEEIVSLRGLLR